MVQAYGMTLFSVFELIVCAHMCVYLCVRDYSYTCMCILGIIFLLL